MLNKIARHVQAAGATVLRGGVFKPRTSPYSFQGHGEPALKWMRACGDDWQYFDMLVGGLVSNAVIS
jgi:3-deoxy-7-phosphoheptulonate synthase